MADDASCVTVLNALRDLDVSLARIATLVVTDKQARAFVKGLTASQLEALQQPIAIADDDAAVVKSALVSSVLGQLRDFIQAEEDSGNHNNGDGAVLLPEGPLRDFTPICDQADVAQHINRLVLDGAQQDLQRHPDGAAAVDDVLRPAADAIVAAVSRAVAQRCREPGVARICRAVVDAAIADFRPVYEVVWARICANEEDGAAEFKEAVASLSLPASGAVQTAADAVQLLQHAAKAKLEYDRVVRGLVKDVSGVQLRLSIPPVRACKRVCGCACVCACVRACVRARVPCVRPWV
jgi:hypothetical protein